MLAYEFVGRSGQFGVTNTAMPEPVDRQTADDLLTAEEVAALLRVRPAWVYSETRRHRIPHIRLGRYVRYRRGALMAWMDQLEDGPLVEHKRSNRLPGVRAEGRGRDV